MARLLIVLAVISSGCTLLLPEPRMPSPAAYEFRCLDLAEAVCDEAWAVVVERWPSEPEQIEEAVVGRAGGAAECHPDPCEEQISVTIDYTDGDGITAFLVRDQGGHLMIDQVTQRIVD